MIISNLFGKEELARLAKLATFEILAFRIVHQTICCLAVAQSYGMAQLMTHQLKHAILGLLPIVAEHTYSATDSVGQPHNAIVVVPTEIT